MCHSGWWFGTFVIFPYVGNIHPNWLIFFRGVETTNQHCYVWLTWEMYQSYHHWFQSHHSNGLVILEQLLFPDLPPETSLSLSQFTTITSIPLSNFGARVSASYSQTFSSHWSPQGIRRLQSSSHDTQLNFKIRQQVAWGCLPDPRKLAMLDRHSRRLSTHRKWLLHQLRLTQAHLVWLCYPANIEFAVNPWIIPLVYIYINISLLSLIYHYYSY